MFPNILDKEEMQDNELNLIKSEINRARHFIDHSNNPDEQIKIIDNGLMNMILTIIQINF